MFRSIIEELAALKQELVAHKRNLQKLRLQKAIYAAGTEPLHLLNQIEREEREIRSIEAKLRRKYVGCVAPAVLIAGALTILLTLGLLGSRYLLALFSPTHTPTPTKTPVIVLSPTITDTPTLTPVPSPTPTPTPYYVEIVVDASERMNDDFEGGITKMESAWQTAGTIARIRAQRGQFVSIRAFGSGGEQTDMGCFETYSVFPFTNQDSEIKAHLMTPPVPGGQAAVVTALTDASAELRAYENIGREIILLTGGDDGCGSALLTFYDSENRLLWTQTFVVLFAGQDFGPFIALRAKGADIRYDLVRDRAEAEAVAEEVAHSLPPTPVVIAMVTPPTFPLPPPTTGGEPQPTSTPKPPPPSPTKGVATATRPPTPTDTPIPPTDTPVPPTDTPVPPTDTPIPPTDTPVPPTDTPTPTCVPSLNLFLPFEDDAEPARWTINVSSGGTVEPTMDATTYAPGVGSSKSMRIHTHVPTADVRYEDIRRSLGCDNWSGSSTLEIWVKTDGANTASEVAFAVFLVDADNELWASSRHLPTNNDWTQLSISISGQGEGNPFDHTGDFVVPDWVQDRPGNRLLDKKGIREIWIGSSTTPEDAQQGYLDFTVWVDHFVRH